MSSCLSGMDESIMKTLDPHPVEDRLAEFKSDKRSAMKERTQRSNRLAGRRSQKVSHLLHVDLQHRCLHILQSLGCLHLHHEPNPFLLP